MAIKKIELIERLRERNAIADFFDAGASGAPAARLEVDPAASHVVLLATPADELFARKLERSALGARRARALPRDHGASPSPASKTPDRKLPSTTSRSVSRTLSPRRWRWEAGYALLSARTLSARGAVMSYDDLGAYRYLMRVPVDSPSRDRHARAISVLVNYDRSHASRLFRTLETFLACRGSIVNTADALFIHQNTLRQRLRRIRELAGLDLRTEDWLTVEIAVKLASLRELGQAESDTLLS